MESDALSFAPCRSLDDFILPHEARFSMPSLKDPKKFNRRVLSNLIYYQTNYFVLMILSMMIFGYINFERWFLGMIVVILLTFAGLLLIDFPNINCIIRVHPGLTFLSAFGIICFVAYIFECIFIFTLSLIIPIGLILLHATFRTRDFLNKIVYKVSNIKKTPMSIILSPLQLEK